MKGLLLSLLVLSLPLQAKTTKTTSRQVLVISGMDSEGEIAQGTGVLSVLSGGSPATLQAALAKVDPSTISAVISFGVGGGTNSALYPGDIVIGSGVVEVETGRSLPTDKALNAKIISELQNSGLWVYEGMAAVVETNNLGYTSAQKASIGEKFNALEVDNESMVAAQWADANGLPYAIIRSVDDPQSLTLPPAALQALNSDGSIDLQAVLQSIEQDPGQIPALVEVAYDEESALWSLGTVTNYVSLGGL
jgi:adenosylhomocysteine nucleosidase